MIIDYTFLFYAITKNTCLYKDKLLQHIQDVQNIIHESKIYFNHFLNLGGGPSHFHEPLYVEVHFSVISIKLSKRVTVRLHDAGT